MFAVAVLVFPGRESIGGFLVQNPSSRPPTHSAFFLHSKLFLYRGKVERVDGQSCRLAAIRRQSQVPCFRSRLLVLLLMVLLLCKQQRM